MSAGKPSPKMQMALMAREVEGWIYRNGFLVHPSGLHVTYDEEGFFFVYQYPSARYNELSNAMRDAEQIHEYLVATVDQWRIEALKSES